MSRVKKRVNPFDAPSDDPVSLPTGLLVAKRVLLMIDSPAVVAGGLAMQLYGFQRATKDVDILASRLLPSSDQMSLKRAVSFGGAIYSFNHKNKTIAVDVIVRNDALAPLYQSAIACPHYIRKLPVPSPEHMALIKYRAGRDKDLMDLRYLLGNRLFSVKKAAKLLRSLYEGAGGALLAEEFEHDMQVEKILMRTEVNK